MTSRAHERILIAGHTHHGPSVDAYGYCDTCTFCDHCGPVAVGDCEHAGVEHVSLFSGARERKLA